MSAHLRLLSAAHRPPAPVSAPAPASHHRLRFRLPPPPGTRLRLLLRPPRLGGSQARFARAVRCAAEASAVARAAEDGGDGGEEAAGAGIWEQVRDIVVFAGPALGLWICGPLMSLIDTMVIGQTSALQLAALGSPSTPPLYAFSIISVQASSCDTVNCNCKFCNSRLIFSVSSSSNPDANLSLAEFCTLLSVFFPP